MTNEAYAARGQIIITGNKRLSLDGSYALGQHMAVLKKLPANSFVKLDLGKLGIESRDLANISHLTGLQSLDLAQTDIDDAALQYLKPLTNLQFISFSQTLVKGHTLGELANLPKLVRLHLSHCDMDPSTLSALSKFKSLVHLHIDSDKVSDSTIDSLLPLKQLEDLTMDGNTTITDTGVKKLVCLKNLHHLSLNDSKVTCAGIMTLKLLPLTALHVASTRVTIGSLTTLRNAFPHCEIEMSKTPNTPIEVFAPLH